MNYSPVTFGDMSSAVMGTMPTILYNVICKQNPNHHTKKDLKSKFCFKMYLKSKYNHRGFHKSKILQSNTIDANTIITKLRLLSKCSS